ncbi:MFS transporter, partial [Nocardiopsis tropica]|nr:MFS transporter [Nocardiopsis tropica]
MSPQQSTVGKPATNRRVLIGSLSGSTIEWFDFFLYATAAALIFDKQFFPNDDPLISLMLSYLSLSLTFFIRPFGGIVFSHIGDRIGRKKTLVITLSLMGGATVAIGLLPNYDQVGVLAPVLLILCRVVQGLAIGGEWGGALLLAYEYAPENRRGFFGSVPQTGITIGMLMSTVAFALVSLMPAAAFESWGWRIPFVASVVLVFVGLWIRKGLAETPA